MSLSNSNSVTSGLAFSYDMYNPKSWIGKPTTNYAYGHNARTDTSYTSFSATSSGSWNAKHSDAITVYNDAGDNISGYYNSGVGDWTNTYHAIWTYDYELQRPVVTMRDIDGQWKAKSFSLSVSTPAGMGLSVGSTYSISWLSWTDDINKCANAGMYSRRASDGNYNFWDGQSNSQSTALNTKPRTWQRVYAVYTVFSGMDINASWTCYMYGHYGNRGTVKIADVQIEAGPPSSFSKVANRLANSNLETSPNFPSWNTNAGSSASGGTLTFTNGSYNSKSGWDLYKTYSGLSTGVNYTWSALVKLGTASNFIVTMNNTQSWNTGPATNFTSLNSSGWTRVSITGTTSSGSFNLHLGASFNDAMASVVQTAGTVFIQDVRLERTDSKTSLVDLTGQSTCVVNSLTYANDGTFSFNGTSNSIEIPISGSPSLYSMDIAIKNYKAMSGGTSMGPYYSAVGFTANGYSTIGLNLGEWTGSLTNETVSFWHYGSAQGAVSIQDTIDSNWNIYSINWNGSAYEIWVNGIKRTTYSFGTVNLITNLTKISVGYNQGWAYWFNGSIGALKIYNRQLTDNEVRQNFSALRGRFGV